MTPDLLSATALALILAWLPGLLLKRSRALSLVLLILYILFIWHLHGVLFNEHLPIAHDSQDNLFGLFLLIHQWLSQSVAFGWNPYIGAGQPLALLNNFLEPLTSIFCF